MRRKGFTLIELLAVIVILAVIALIATPLIMNTINDARDSAMQRSVQNIQHSAETHYMTQKMLDDKYVFSLNDFDYKGEKYEDMNISFNSINEASVAVYKDKCFYILAGTSNVVIDEELDEAACLEKVKKVSGRPVYLDPTDLTKVCNANNSIVATGTKEGCMKWYTILEDSNSDTVTLILAHNTTATVEWNSEGGTTMKEVATALINDTTGWDNSIKNTARLITMEELAEIVGKTNYSGATSYETEEEMFADMFWFEDPTWDLTQEAMPTFPAQGEAKYAWLFDYTNGCTGFGCSVADSTTQGYWTSNHFSFPGTPGDAFFVGSDGCVYYVGVHYGDFIGLRPVISISKSIIH